MPRGFSEREKEIIRGTLREKGNEYFGTYGLRKTTVEDLARAAGISKGAFYLFYQSKEELFFDILEQFEAEFKANILKDFFQPGTSPRQGFKELLKTAISIWKSHPLFKHVSREDYEHLRRALPAERVQNHVRYDDSSMVELLAQLAHAGAGIDCDPRMAAGLTRALVFVSLHEEDFNTDIYPDMMDVLVDLVSQYVVKE